MLWPAPVAAGAAPAPSDAQEEVSHALDAVQRELEILGGRAAPADTVWRCAQARYRHLRALRRDQDAHMARVLSSVLAAIDEDAFPGGVGVGIGDADTGDTDAVFQFNATVCALAASRDPLRATAEGLLLQLCAHWQQRAAGSADVWCARTWSAFVTQMTGACRCDEAARFAVPTITALDAGAAAAAAIDTPLHLQLLPAACTRVWVLWMGHWALWRPAASPVWLRAWPAIAWVQPRWVAHAAAATATTVAPTTPQTPAVPATTIFAPLSTGVTRASPASPATRQWSRTPEQRGDKIGASVSRWFDSGGRPPTRQRSMPASTHAPPFFLRSDVTAALQAAGLK